MSIWIRFLLALATLGLLVWIGREPSRYRDTVSALSWIWLVFAFALVHADRVLMAWKWNWLLKLSTAGLTTIRATQIYCASSLWGLFLPATLGADVIRIACTSREGIDYKIVTGSVVMERSLGFIANLAFGMIAFWSALISRPDDRFLWIGFAALGLGLLAVTAILWVALHETVFRWVHEALLAPLPGKRLQRVLETVHTAVMGYRDSPRTLALFAVASLAETWLTALFFWAVFRACGVDVGFWPLAAAMSIALLIARIPVSIAGLGIFEGGMAAVLVRYGVPIETSVVASLLGRVVQIAAWLPWWGMYLVGPGALPPGITVETVAKPSQGPKK